MCLFQGNYTFYGEEIDWTAPNMPMLPYGHFLVNLTTAGKAGRGAMSFCGDVILVPKS